ncbi:aryl-sulfate sulfohydrolase [Pedobacter yulinensis]|uniref:Aryl-sulfate sulfohydrolase n=1 Tax=Pedobacter yulinensis TaxID=2126353 RepID=A0A2T3HHD4_9SPHI|nr:aryl-sulfate sulfohydrolase [Pedobacter yulinensis]
MIVADDLGYKDVGFTGSNWFETPRLDGLAAESMVFNQAYAAAANCAPSRACMLSGLNTPRHGIYTVGTSARGAASDRKLVPVKNTDDLAPRFYTLAEMLRDAGYDTGIIGKWHLGKDPLTQGFSYNFGGNHRGSNKYFVPYQNPDIPDGQSGEYLTYRLGREAEKYITAHKDKPFFLYLPYYAVHTPLQAPDSLKQKYAAKKAAGAQNHVTYGAMVEALDQSVGGVLDKLAELGLRENTIVIFTSDNGGIRSISSQEPLRAGKGSYYEGGIRVPLLVRWPAAIKAGSRTETPVTNMDFYPTLMEVAGFKKSLELDGQSLVPLWQGGKLAGRPLYWHFPIYLQAYDPQKDDGYDPLFRTRPGSAVRSGKWKLIRYDEDQVVELYDLERDPAERKNLAQVQPQIKQKMLKQLNDWLTMTQAPLPAAKNPDYKKKI